MRVKNEGKAKGGRVDGGEETKKAKRREENESSSGPCVDVSPNCADRGKSHLDLLI